MMPIVDVSGTRCSVMHGRL